MSSLGFLCAATALLALPGPTNALFAASGATAGISSALKLIPVAVIAYLLSIGLVSAVLGQAASAHERIALIIQIGAALYLGWSAIRLWRGSISNTLVSGGTARRMFLTTALNPKVLIFAFAIFPMEQPVVASLIFAAAASSIGLGWILLGRFLCVRAGAVISERQIWRMTAAIYAGFAVLVSSTAIARAWS